MEAFNIARYSLNDHTGFLPMREYKNKPKLKYRGFEVYAYYSGYDYVYNGVITTMLAGFKAEKAKELIDLFFEGKQEKITPISFVSNRMIESLESGLNWLGFADRYNNNLRSLGL